MKSASTNVVLQWLSEEDLSSIPTSDFWNDEELEKEKPYYILNKDPRRLLHFLQNETTYYAQYEAALRFVHQLGLQVRGTGVDVAAGICWTTALLSREDLVEQLYAVEVSKHRLLKLAPAVCDFLGGDQQKIVRALGSFYDMRLPNSSVDFCMMCQAFHHADNPNRLLDEIARILKPGGVVMTIGEEPITPRMLLFKRLTNIVKMLPFFPKTASLPVYKVLPTFEELYPADPEGGDHYYRIEQYKEIFNGSGFVLHQQRIGGSTIFVALKE